MSDSESTITGTLGPQPLRPRGLPSPVTWCSCCSGKETPLACAEDTGGQNTACLLEEPPESRVPPLPRYRPSAMAQAVGRRRRTCHLVKTPRGSPVPTLKTRTLKSQNYVILPRVQRERVIEPRSDQAQCDILGTVAPDMGSCSRAGLDTGTPVECRCEGSRGDTSGLDWRQSSQRRSPEKGGKCPNGPLPAGRSSWQHRATGRKEQETRRCKAGRL